MNLSIALPCSTITTFPAVDEVFSSESKNIIIEENIESNNESKVNKQYVPDPKSDFKAIETLSDANEVSISFDEGIAYKPAQLIRENDACENYSPKYLNENKGIDIDKTGINIKSLSQVDHIYEEVGRNKEPPYWSEFDILDYYEKYSPTTAKTLINTLLLPRQKICKQCASLKYSPVYSDQYIYKKKPLYAREVSLHHLNDLYYFKHSSQRMKCDTNIFSNDNDIQDHMPLYNYSKTTKSGIFYLSGPTKDIFDLKTTCKPELIIISSTVNVVNDVVNTQLYHRYINDTYTRISNNGYIPMTFEVNHDYILSTIKNIGYDTDLQNWINYRNNVLQSCSSKQNELSLPEHHPNRSSLLLLEPLLLMPDLTSTRQRHNKNRIPHTEHLLAISVYIWI
ncbi:hypothetical protein KPH14_009542 [Odynerus spinipes]|uniref:Uncharacterized protein n=1 Tax=Odynerus spinipes TaxID=1348599 RepID=A0AAD9RQ63_9HYME|nr:hypothetical protein KPH14_009542 [Odynerus spinipes]